MDLQVSVVTVKRAYLELERKGVFATQHDKGSVVAARSDAAARLYEEELARQLEQAARLGRLLGISPKEMQARLREAADPCWCSR